MCRSNRAARSIIKYADDTVIVSLLHGKEASHGPIVAEFTDWCDKSYLQLNVTKTKDMAIDFRKHPQAQMPTDIKGQILETVDKYKYRGTIFDNKLTFEANCEAVFKKANQHLYCLRKLSYLHIDRTLLTIFYCAFIESILSFCLVCWFSNLSLKKKNSLKQIVRWSSRLIGEPQLNPEALYTRQLQRIAGSILRDGSRPLHKEFRLLPSGRRYKLPACKTKRFRESFVPSAIREINKTYPLLRQ